MTQLLSLLKQIHQTSQQLLDCLHAEKLALDDRQYDNLETLASQKAELLSSLQQQDQQRISVSTDRHFNRFITDSGDPELIRQWNSTRDLITRCQQQNEVNGRMLQRQGEIHQDLMNLLTGREAGEQQTYDADGSQARQGSLLGKVKA